MRNECNIIRDILPLYIEDMVSTDTADFVEEHLEKCQECHWELNKMKDPGGLEAVYEDYRKANEQEARRLKRLKLKMELRSAGLVLAAVILILGVIFLPSISAKMQADAYMEEKYDGYIDVDRVHYISVGRSDLAVNVRAVYDDVYFLIEIKEGRDDLVRQYTSKYYRELIAAKDGEGYLKNITVDQNLADNYTESAEALNKRDVAFALDLVFNEATSEEEFIDRVEWALNVLYELELTNCYPLTASAELDGKTISARILPTQFPDRENIISHIEY